MQICHLSRRCLKHFAAMRMTSATRHGSQETLKTIAFRSQTEIAASAGPSGYCVTSD